MSANRFDNMYDSSSNIYFDNVYDLGSEGSDQKDAISYEFEVDTNSAVFSKAKRRSRDPATLDTQMVARKRCFIPTPITASKCRLLDVPDSLPVRKSNPHLAKPLTNHISVSKPFSPPRQLPTDMTYVPGSFSTDLFPGGTILCDEKLHATLQSGDRSCILKLATSITNASGLYVIKPTTTSSGNTELYSIEHLTPRDIVRIDHGDGDAAPKATSDTNPQPVTVEDDMDWHATIEVPLVYLRRVLHPS